MIEKLKDDFFGKITFPKIHKVAATMLATELVSVQAMERPTGAGLSYYIDLRQKTKYQVYNNLRDGVKYYDRDEFYAYDELLQAFLDKSYPEEYLK